MHIAILCPVWRICTIQRDKICPWHLTEILLTVTAAVWLLTPSVSHPVTQSVVYRVVAKEKQQLTRPKESELAQRIGYSYNLYIVHRQYTTYIKEDTIITIGWYLATCFGRDRPSSGRLRTTILGAVETVLNGIPFRSHETLVTCGNSYLWIKQWNSMVKW